VGAENTVPQSFVNIITEYLKCICRVRIALLESLSNKKCFSVFF